MKKIYEETRLIPLAFVKSCKKGGGFYMTPPLALKLVKRVVGSICPPTCVKTYKKGGGFYITPQVLLKLLNK